MKVTRVCKLVFAGIILRGLVNPDPFVSEGV